MIPYIKATENEITSALKDVTDENISLSLNRARHNIQDFINLISPAASDKIAEFATIGTKIKNMHFGKTIKLYTPLYISNYCINHCSYCGFNNKAKQPRTRLTMDELIEEAKTIRSFGIDSLLLVSGEDPKYISIEYLKEATIRLKKIFSYISIEIYPLSQDDYKTLFDAGIDGLTIYQETYDLNTYNKTHISGPKADYDFRLQSIINGAEAGFRTLGLGMLLGLYDWRIEAISLAVHAMWLRKKYWKSKIQFSFPRITPTGEDFNIPFLVSEKELEQMVLAFRIVFPDAEISISTRENREFRNRIALSAATILSAASSVVPGGYAKKDSKDLGQFSLHDTRDVKDMDLALRDLGIDPVYKDWDRCLV
jgi:2-iminoacetate synthase